MATMGRRATMALGQMSPTAIPGRSSPAQSEHGSSTSGISFKHWHRRMQTLHQLMEESGRPGFGLWRWCFIACTPCRMFDRIDYEKKLCVCCFKFKTFKIITTILLIAIFGYIFMFSLFKKELLPGGTVFLLFIISVISYLVGYLLTYAGLPPMFGNLLVGLIFGNLPSHWLPAYNSKTLHEVTKAFEKILLLIALIRAGLLLDLSRIKTRVQFILRISLFPFISEFVFVLLASRFLIELPWSWSALQGSLLCIVSLASVTSVMQKNIQTGYGEDKHLSTVLIAASALDVIVGVFIYVTCMTYIFPTVEKQSKEQHVWRTMGNVLGQIVLGLTLGIVCGILIAFFPDKRHSEAPAIRIAIIGIGSLAIANVLNEFDLGAAGVLSTLTMCLVASNMWEELGWHESSNPVQYFYTMSYYFSAPVGLSLIGFSLKLSESNGKEVGLAITLIIIGLIARETICFVTTLGKLYPTTIKEKVFICIAWVSKGTFQALLAFAVEYYTKEREDMGDATKQKYLYYARILKQTTIIAILLTTPLACYSLTILTPVLLTKQEQTKPPEPDPEV